MTHTAEMTVQKSIVVNVPQAHAFDVFTKKFGTWWPMKTHHIGTQDAQDVVLEPREGGRWYERGTDGTECVWGHVIVWDPSARIVLSWEISAEFKADPRIQTEVEVNFVVEGPKATRVVLEHRKLDQFGEKTAVMRDILGGEMGWPPLLEAFAATAAGSVENGKMAQYNVS